jgi:hypothetical protein
MPGYASQPNPNRPVIADEPEEIDEFYDNVFYGVRFDAETGRAFIEKIGSDEVIRLPEEGITRTDDYVHYFTSPKRLQFTWSETDASRLLLEVT